MELIITACFLLTLCMTINISVFRRDFKDAIPTVNDCICFFIFGIILSPIFTVVLLTKFFHDYGDRPITDLAWWRKKE